MVVPVVASFIEVGFKLLDKLIPDPESKARAQLELMRLQQEGAFRELELDLQGRLAQTEVNKVEAGSEDPFRGGWRPFIGWICGIGLAYQLLGQPLLEWLSYILLWPVPPKLETETLMTLLFGMLGLGAYRTVEKIKK